MKYDLMRKRKIIILFGLMICIQFLYSQSIKGFINDETNKPISYASITIKHQSKGAISNEQGYFEISVPNRDSVVLIISKIGYRSEVIGVNTKEAARTLQQFTLHSFASTLNEVIVTSNAYKVNATIQLPDLHDTYIISGKKNEVIPLVNAQANLAEKTGRQISAQIELVYKS